MHGIIPYMFDCWANLVVHLLLLKSSMAHSLMQRTLTIGGRITVRLFSSLAGFDLTQ